MKTRSSGLKRAGAAPHASAFENAAAIAPPAYGIDFVDRGVQPVFPGGVVAQRYDDPAAVHAAAARGTRGAGGPLPHLQAIQSAFGRHDVAGVRAYTGAAASEASLAMGAEAFAFGNAVGFAGAPSLRVAAHEAAHVVQQRAGVHLKGGIGQAGDAYERHADAVAAAVVQGRNAQALLDRCAPRPDDAGSIQRNAVQRNGFARTEAVTATTGLPPGIADLIAGYELRTSAEVVAAIVKEVKAFLAERPARRYDTGFNGPRAANEIVSAATLAEIQRDWQAAVQSAVTLDKDMSMRDAYSSNVGPQTGKRMHDFLIHAGSPAVFNFHIEVEGRKI
jgi:Domain of unknown function (DUF4157)